MLIRIAETIGVDHESIIGTVEDLQRISTDTYEFKIVAIGANSTPLQRFNRYFDTEAEAVAAFNTWKARADDRVRREVLGDRV